MKKKKTVETNDIKLEGVGLNAASVSKMSRADWLEFGKERYFQTINNKTATEAQQAEMLGKAYDLAHEKMGTTAKPVAPKGPTKPEGDK